MSEDRSFHVRPMTAPDADAVQRLWSHRFGGDDSTQENWIAAALRATHSAVGLVAVDQATGDVVGLSFLDVADAAFTRQYLGLAALDISLDLAEQNGIFHLSCVHPGWEGRGIGSTFYERRFTELASRNVSHAYGLAWHRPHTVDSRALFEKWDFTSLAVVERYYSRTGERPHCPDCDDACTCTASIYTRRVDDL